MEAPQQPNNTVSQNDLLGNGIGAEEHESTSTDASTNSGSAPAMEDEAFVTAAVDDGDDIATPDAPAADAGFSP